MYPTILEITEFANDAKKFGCQLPTTFTIIFDKNKKCKVTINKFKTRNICILNNFDCFDNLYLTPNNTNHYDNNTHKFYLMIIRMYFTSTIDEIYELLHFYFTNVFFYIPHNLFIPYKEDLNLVLEMLNKRLSSQTTSLISEFINTYKIVDMYHTILHDRNYEYYKISMVNELLGYETNIIDIYDIESNNVIRYNEEKYNNMLDTLIKKYGFLSKIDDKYFSPEKNIKFYNIVCEYLHIISPYKLVRNDTKSIYYRYSVENNDKYKFSVEQYKDFCQTMYTKITKCVPDFLTKPCRD